jgi:aspartate aminotransferase
VTAEASSTSFRPAKRLGAIGVSDGAFCGYLLERHDVAVVPGSCFGLAPYVRLSYATSEQNLREAVKRIARACRELS